MKLPQITVASNTISLQNLTIIVGSNGVGKTTFLRDLYNQFITTRPNETSVNHNFEAKWQSLFNGKDSSTINDWRAWLMALSVVTGEQQNNQPVFALPKSLGREQKPQKISQSDKNDAINYINSPGANVDGLSNSWSHIFRDQQTAFLSVDNRFYVSKNFAGQLNPDTSSNLQPAPFLAINEDVLRKINHEMQNLFDKKIFVESPLYPNYNILSANTDVTTPKRLSTTPSGLLKQRKIYEQWVENNSITHLNEEGHGIRAAFEILYSLKIDANKVIFIDEPEIHLYPSSKYQLGKIIGSYAKSNRQIILSTHDAELLRGLLSSAVPTTIIKIKRDRNVVSVERQKIRNTVTTDSLQTAFLDAVVITEGVTDQFVYRSIFQQRKILQSKGRSYSYEIVAVNGKESIGDDFEFYKALDISFVAILDYDAIFSTKRGGLIVNCLEKIGVGNSIISEVGQLITEISASTKNYTDRKYGLRSKELTKDQRKKIKDLLYKLKQIGIFIVPSGNLESWVGEIDHIPPQDIYNKYRSSSNKKYKKLSEFVEEVGNYLEGAIT